jgi:hypothetical protein
MHITPVLCCDVLVGAVDAQYRSQMVAQRDALSWARFRTPRSSRQAAFPATHVSTWANAQAGLHSANIAKRFSALALDCCARMSAIRESLGGYAE